MKTPFGNSLKASKMLIRTYVYHLDALLFLEFLRLRSTGTGVMDLLPRIFLTLWTNIALLASTLPSKSELSTYNSIYVIISLGRARDRTLSRDHSWPCVQDCTAVLVLTIYPMQSISKNVLVI